MNFEFESLRTREKDLQAYKEAFDYYDWNKSGIIAVKVKVAEEILFCFHDYFMVILMF